MLPVGESLHQLHKRLRLTVPKPAFFGGSPRSPFRSRSPRSRSKQKAETELSRVPQGDAKV